MCISHKRFSHRPMQLCNTTRFQFRQCLVELMECNIENKIAYQYRVLDCRSMVSVISKFFFDYKDFLESAYLSALSIEINQTDQPIAIIDLCNKSFIEANLPALKFIEIGKKVKSSLLQEIETFDFTFGNEWEIIKTPPKPLCLLRLRKFSQL